MPVSPALAEDLSRPTGQRYEAAEVALLALLAAALGVGIGSPAWAAARLAATGAMLRQVQQIVDALQTDVTVQLQQAIQTAYERGSEAALEDLRAAQQPEGHPVAETAAVAALVAGAVALQRPVWQRLLHVPLDAYRRIIRRGTVAVDRQQVVQQELDRLAAAGITGFTDKAGRNWSAAGYGEMVTRTAAGQAVVQGGLDALRAAQQHLVAVSVAPLACPLCVPWEGQILSLAGPDPRAKGTVAEATAAGLWHVNCRHSMRPWIPGTPLQTVPPHPEGATYKDVQRQRYLERQTRAWRRREAVALDDAARRRARQRIRDYQTRIRRLTGDLGLERYPARER